LPTDLGRLSVRQSAGDLGNRRYSTKRERKMEENGRGAEIEDKNKEER
jgi:hypothetical protein